MHFHKLSDHLGMVNTKNEISGTPRNDKQKKLLDRPYFESEVRSKNGELRIIGWTNTTLKDKFGQTIGILSTGEDITERKKLETIKQKYTDKLEETVKERTKEPSEALEAEKKINELKSAFITIASHDLRTPITIILSSIILIERYNEKGEYQKQQKIIDRIKSASYHFTSILDDFLSSDKLERGRVRVVKENLDLQEFVPNLLDDMEGMLKTGQQIVHTHNGST